MANQHLQQTVTIWGYCFAFFKLLIGNHKHICLDFDAHFDKKQTEVQQIHYIIIGTPSCGRNLNLYSMKDDNTRLPQTLHMIKDYTFHTNYHRVGSKQNALHEDSYSLRKNFCTL